MYPSETHYIIHQNDHNQRLERSAQRRLIEQPAQPSANLLRRVGRLFMLFFL